MSAQYAAPSFSSRVTRGLLMVDAALLGVSALSYLRWLTFPEPDLLLKAAMEDSRTLSTLGAGFMFLTAIWFFRWLYRSHKNLEALGAGSLAFSHRGAIGWWFVPFANLFKPPVIVDELTRASRLDGAGEAWKKLAPWPAVNAWWFSWLGANILASLSMRIDLDTLAQIQRYAVAVAISDLIEVAAALILIRIIKQVDADQESRRLEYDPNAAAPSPSNA